MPSRMAEDVLTAVSPHCGLALDSRLGGERYERAVLERLPRSGIELELGLPRSRAPQSPPAGWRVALLRPGRGLRWWVAPLAFVPYTAHLLRRRRADLLRAHSIRFVAPSLLLARALTRSRVPIVMHHLHTDRGWRRFEGFLLRRADAVITISEHSAADLRAMGVAPERIHVVACGIDPPLEVAPDAGAWPAGEGLRVLHLGRLEPRKRPDLALAGFAAAVGDGLDARLLFAGGGSLRARLQAQAGGLAPRVGWRERFDDREKWGLLRAADVLVATSEQEGFGLVVGEAQAAGVPVVTTAGTATAEVVEHGVTGLVVEADARAIGAALHRLADPRMRATMAAAAARRAAAMTWDRCAADVAEVYRRTAA